MSGAPFTNAHPDAATLGAYHDGELRGFTHAEVEGHLAACPRCRRELSDLEAVTDALHSLPRIEPSPQVHGAVLARVARLRPRRRVHRRRWALAALLAALAVMLAGYDVLVSPHPGLVLQSARAPRLTASRPRPAMPPPARMMAPAGAASRPQAPGEQFHAAESGAGAAAGRQPGAGGVSGSLAGSAGSGPYTVDARLIARTGDVDMRVRDVQRAFNAAGGIAAREGGYVADSNSSASTTTHGTYAATLTLRVPAAHFGATMNALAALPHGTLAERSTSLDITDSYHNLQARLQALQATRDQLLALMHKSGSIHDAMAVLDQLTAVDTDLDTVQGQIMASANSVMLSTITVNLAPEPRQQVIVPTRRHHQVPGWHPGRDAAAAVANLVRALEAIATIAIYAGVYLALPAALVALALLMHRLWRRARDVGIV